MHDYAHLFLEITATWWYCCLVAPFKMDYFQEPMPPGISICNYYKIDYNMQKEQGQNYNPYAVTFMHTVEKNKK